MVKEVTLIIPQTHESLFFYCWLSDFKVVYRLFNSFRNMRLGNFKSLNYRDWTL